MLVMRRRLKKPLIERDWILSPLEMASWSGWWILTGLGELSCVGIFWLIVGSSTDKWDNGICAVSETGKKNRAYAKAHFA